MLSKDYNELVDLLNLSNKEDIRKSMNVRVVKALANSLYEKSRGVLALSLTHCANIALNVKIDVTAQLTDKEIFALTDAYAKSVLLSLEVLLESNGFTLEAILASPTFDAHITIPD